jgi:ArsR family transcriptional regulator
MNDKYEVLRVLSDGTRFNIFRTLLDFDRLCVSEVEQLLGIKQANTSKHLKKLKDYGIVVSKREKNTVFYSVSSEFLHNNELLIRYLLT